MVKRLKKNLSEPSMKRNIPPCKGCGEPINGFSTNGYCENCLCPDCGNTLDTENERAQQICEDCDQ